MSFHRPPERGTWVARYDSDQDPPLKYDEEYDQPTCSRVFDRKNWVGDIISEHQACARVLRWLWEKHAVTRKLLGLSLPEGMPEHVHSLLRACPDCEKQLPCVLFQGLVNKGGEESEGDPDDSAYDTSGLGSDDSGLSDVASGKTKADKKKQAKKPKGQENKATGKDKEKKSEGQWKQATGKDRPKKSVGQDKNATGIVPEEKDLGESKSRAKPKAGGSRSLVTGSAKPKDGGSPGVGKATAKPQKGGSPGILPEIESGGGGRGGRGRGGKGAREGGGGARSRSRSRGSGAMTAMESKGGVQHSEDGTMRLSAAPAAVFRATASTGQHSAKSEGGVRHSDAMSDGTVRLSAAPAAVFGASASTGQHPAKSVDIGGSARMATPACRTHLRPSSSSYDSSSSSSAPRPPAKKHRPGEKTAPPTEAGAPAAEPPVSGPSASEPQAGPRPTASGSAGKGKVCAACLTKDNHNVEECPLLRAVKTGTAADIQEAKSFAKDYRDCTQGTQILGGGQTPLDLHGSLSNRTSYVESGPMVIVCLLPFVVYEYRSL